MDKSTKQGLAAWLVCVGILFGVIAYGSGAMNVASPIGGSSTIPLSGSTLTVGKINFSGVGCSGTSGAQLCWDGSSALHYYINSTEHWASNQGTGGLTTQFAFTSMAGSGSNGLALSTNGARIDFGAGASDYASSDGTTVTFAGPVTATGVLNGTTRLQTGSVGGIFTGANAGVVTAGYYYQGSIADSAGNSLNSFGGVSALTSGLDRYAAVFYRDNGSTVSSRITTDGTYLGGLGADGTHLSVSKTAPTISSGFGTSPSIVASNGSLAFQINVGTGGVATSGVIGLPTATTGWVCNCQDITSETTTVTYTKQTASSTTTCTVGNFTDIAGAGAWASADKLNCIAVAY